MASTTATKQTMFVTERAIPNSKKYPGWAWTRTMDIKQPEKPMTLAFSEEQIPFINDAKDNRIPLEEDVHFHYDPGKEGTFLLPHVGIERLQEVPVIQQTNSRKTRKAPARGTTNQEHVYDDLIEDDEPPLSWDTSRDPRLIKAETFAREIAYLAEILIKEHPSLNREDCRAIANTAFIQAQKS